MKICITRGIYGFRKNGNVIEKTKNDPPFEVDDEEGERLVSLRVAECVDVLPEATEDAAEKENVHDEEQSSRTGYISRSSLEELNKEDLIVLAEEFGIKKYGNKADLVERLMQCPVAIEDEGLLDEEEMPELNAEEPD